MNYKLILIFVLLASFFSCKEKNTSIPPKKEEEIRKVEYRIICDTIDVFDLDQKNGDIKFSKEIICDTILINR